MKMKSVYCYMLAGLMLSASSCSSWLSEDDSILQPIPTTQPPTTQAPVDPDEDQEEIKIISKVISS